MTTEEMSGTTEAAFLSAIKLHVTGNLALIRAAEEELIKNKVTPATIVRKLHYYIELTTLYCNKQP